MDDELSLEFIDELLSERDTALGKPTYKIPVQTSEYVKSVPQEARCMFLNCGAPTYFRIKEQPYCTVHAIHYMGNLLDEKINHYPGLSPYLEQIMQAYQRMEEHPGVHFDEMWRNIEAKSILIGRPDHQTLLITIEGKDFTKQYRKSPYVDIEGILLLSLLQMLR